MNLRIAIVEDDHAQCTYLQELIQQFVLGKEYTVQFYICNSAEEFLFKYMDSVAIDVIFLDILLGNMSGVELAAKIRAKDKRMQIVFLTGTPEYVFEGYKYNAIRYLLKPIQEAELEQLLEECYKKAEHSANEYFVFQYMGDSVRLPYVQIRTIEVAGHYLKMVTDRQIYEWKGTLTGIKQQFLENGFAPANRSILVNLAYVSKITRTECVLENEDSIPLSRGGYERLNQAFMKYYL